MSLGDDLQLKTDQQLAREVDEEIAFHLDMTRRELVASGWTPASADEEARRRFGRRERHASECQKIQQRRRRSGRRRAWWSGLALDLRAAIRGLRSAPWTTASAITTLALAMGASIIVFSLVDGLLLKALPFPDPGKLVLLSERSAEGSAEHVSPANFEDWRDRAESFVAIAAFEDSQATLTGLGEPFTAEIVVVTDGYFDALGVAPLHGRFLISDDYSRQLPVAVVSESFFQQRLGGQPSRLGEAVTVDGQTVTLVGVAPERATLPHGTDIWAPLHFRFDVASSRGAQYLAVLAREREDVSRTETLAELDTIGQALAQLYPGNNQNRGIHLEPLHDALTRSSQRPILLLMAAMLLVLILGVLDTSSLLLTRGLERRSEFALRAALGSGRSRIVRLVLIEGWLLTGSATLFGMGLAAAGLVFVKTSLPYELPRLDTVAIDARIVAFASLLAVVAGAVAGLIGAGRLQRARLGQRSATQTAESRRLHGALVIGQIVLAVVLAVGAGLLVRSFLAATQVDTGFRSERLLTFRLELPDGTYGQDRERELAFFEQLETELSALPGVEEVGLVPWLPFNPGWFFSYRVVGAEAPADGRSPSASFRPINAAYFDALGIELLSGRTFQSSDRASSQPVVVVNESFAHRAFGDQDPVGRQIVVGYRNPDDGDIERTIVGVTADTKQLGLESSPVPSIYVPHTQIPFDVMSVAVLATGDPLGLVPQVRDVVSQLDGDLALADLATMEERIAAQLGPRRFTATVMASFAALALIIAVVGIYAMLSRLVAARRRELGLRLALGAAPSALVFEVLRHGARMGVIGALIGLGVSFALRRSVESMLFGVSPSDPGVYLVVATALLLIVGAASAIPAWRVVKVDAAETLGSE